jgi:hypothetical protein
MYKNISKAEAAKILRTVPFDQAFHFTNDQGAYTGVTANSLLDFATKLETIDENPILFHYPRGDFQKWIETTLGDKELAEKMCFVKGGHSGKEVRDQLVWVTKRRLLELREV